MKTSSAFFSRPATRSVISRIAQQTELTIYLGAGSTIDRTGMDWAALTSALLHEDFPDQPLRDDVVKGSAALESASVGAQIYENRFGDDWRDRLSDTLRSLLYRQPLTPSGKVVESAVRLGDSVIQRGGSAVIITPNYDDFCVQECVRQDVDWGTASLGPLSEFDDSSLTELISAIRHEESRRFLWVLNIHGILKSGARDIDPGDDADGSDDMLAEEYPVLSEEDYWRTADRSRRLLKEFFSGRTVICAGASMTDPPLLNALLDTKRGLTDHSKRYAILRLSNSSQQKRRYSEKFYGARLKHFGTGLIPVDHYSQVSQFLTEVRVAGETGADTYDSPNSVSRYGPRLVDWWRKWLYSPGTLRSRQSSHHKYLRRQMQGIRNILDAPDAEQLKFELWVRWQPDRQRSLRLWASSVGPWHDEGSMRESEIVEDSDIVAVRAFTTGSAIYRELSGERWKSYIASPVWIDHRSGSMMVGVVVLASMTPQVDSCLGQQNATRISLALLRMHAIGESLLDIK